MRLHLLLFAVLLSSVFVIAPKQSHAGWVEFFFPMLKDEAEDPANTLRAPFAEPEEGEDVEATEEQTDTVDLRNPSNKSVPLNLSHRSDRDIGRWVTTAVADAITFVEEDSAAEMEEHKAKFDKNGWAEFEKFLADTNMIKVIESDRYQLRSYVKGTPLLLNEGSVSQRYRWLYEVSADISYMDRNVKDYDKAEPQTRNLRILVQIGRHKDANNEAGIFIERWDGKVVRAEDQK